MPEAAVFQGLSWNPLTDVQQLFTYPFMVNALAAGTIVAVMAGVTGWFMVLRRQTFAGHTLSVIAFPGAAAASLAVCPSGRGGGACHRPLAWASAAATAFNWCDCHCWKLAEAGTSVSVIVVTGRPRLRAASVIRLTSGVLF